MKALECFLDIGTFEDVEHFTSTGAVGAVCDAVYSAVAGTFHILEVYGTAT